MSDKETIDKAIDMILDWGGIDGGHHKQWTLDQTLRVLAGDRYDDLIKDWESGEDGPETYKWDEGIAP